MGTFYAGLSDELSLYVRQLAWLGTAPQPKEKRALGDAEPVSRLAVMEAEGRTPDLPPLPAPYLTTFLMEIGPVEAGAMDGAPISWTTLRHWQDQIGVTLQPWEARLIRRLSVEYLNQCRKARDPECPPPWGGMTEERRASLDARLRANFGGLAMNRKGGRT